MQQKLMIVERNTWSKVEKILGLDQTHIYIQNSEQYWNDFLLTIFTTANKPKADHVL